MLETLSCIFSLRPGASAAPVAILGALPEDIASLEVPAIAAGQSALRRIGDKLVVLAPQDDGAVIGFVLDAVPPATQLKNIANRLAGLAASGRLAAASSAMGDTLAELPDSARFLTRYLGKARGRITPRRLLAMACDALTNAGDADEVAILVCRPGEQSVLTLSSLRLEPMRDAIGDLLRRWRGEERLTQHVSTTDLEEEDLRHEDTILLLDKAAVSHCYISLPAQGDAGFGFLLFGPAARDPERCCEDLRGILELRHRTQRDWSRRRTYLRRGWMAAAAAFLIFLLLPTDRAITASGVTRPRDVDVVSLHFPTYLDQMQVEVGETLDPGAPIAVLTAPDQDDARASALYQISVEEAAANAALAQDDYGAYVQAQSRVALQQARLQQIEARMALLTPTADGGGRVVAALSGGERGRFLAAGTEIARIQTSHRYTFELTLSPADAGFVAVGQTGELSLRGQLDRAYPIRILTPPAPDTRGEDPEAAPVLIATAMIETEGEVQIVPGLSGFAQIDTGRAIRLAVWTRHIVEFVRMKAWTILNWRI
jgi:hypothetical protein